MINTPQALDYEEKVLGTLLSYGIPAMDMVIDILEESCFYQLEHQYIFSAIFELYANSEPIDTLSVKRRLDKNKVLDKAGGARNLMILTSKSISFTTLAYDSLVLREIATKRSIMNISLEMQKMLADESLSHTEIIDSLDKKIELLRVNPLKNSTESIGRIIMEDKAKILYDDEDIVIESGFANFDRDNGGFNPTDLVVVAGRPAMGKSDVMLEMMYHSAQKEIPLALFSLEMSRIQLIRRLAVKLYNLSGKEPYIDNTSLKNKSYNRNLMNEMLDKASSYPIHINETGGLKVQDFRTECKRLKKRESIQEIFCDYLTLFTTSTKHGIREQAVSEIVQTHKLVAKETETCVIDLAQLNRSVETRGGDKRPQASDLRESGQIEQDANFILLLYRPEVYDIMTDMEGQPTNNLLEIICEKNREGASHKSYRIHYDAQHKLFNRWGHLPITTINNSTSFENRNFYEKNDGDTPF